MDIIEDILYPQYLKSHAVTTDSRHIAPGCIFFAFRGDTFDGNAFAATALQRGAALCVVSDPAARTDSRCLLVDDVLQVLQDLARCHREHMNIPVIGVTGTNGKTTTKELINAVLSRRYRTHATEGNLNNHLGVPLTLLSTPPTTEILIVEMGASHPGEIDMLCGIAQPTAGLITTVGKAHLEGFGSFDGVVQTKTELYRFLATTTGTAFVNEDDPILMDKAIALSTLPDEPSQVPGYIPGMPTQFELKVSSPVLSVVTYGSSETAEARGALVSAAPYMKFNFEEEGATFSVQTYLLGAYNFANAMAAVCVGLAFDVAPGDIKAALEQYVPLNNRSQYQRTQRNGLILDCYNANPSSMAVALDSLLAMPQPHKVAILGGMKELGAASAEEHAALAKRLQASALQQVMLVGEEFRFAANDMQWFATSEEAHAYLLAHPLSDALVLLKGSNAYKLWTLAKDL